jgi:hypothetical protein
MTDVFSEWKKNKFIAAPSEFVEDGTHLVVLTDIEFWTTNYDELCKWCEEHHCKVAGMTVDIVDDETMTLFHLRWL